MFNINEVTPQMENEANSSGLIPEGEYNFLIEAARIAENKKQNGSYLELTCIPEGMNRKMWKYFNFMHVDKRVESLAKVDLKNLCLALEISQITNVIELVGKFFVGRVEHTKNKSGEINAEIRAYGKYVPQENDVPF
jgi:hypothetical protein